MKKRIITLILTGCMALSLAACGKKEEPKDSGTEQTGEAADAKDSAVGTSKVTKLGEYQGVSFTPMDTEVTEEELEARVQEIVQGSTVKRPQETADETSTVNIDYEGKKDGVAFDGGTAAGQELNITNSGYIPGFAESIVGMKPGETKDCPMTFPENYGNEELAGADVVFTITLNECWENVPAELNDEFAQSRGCENVEDFYAQTRESYEAQKQAEAEADKRYQMIESVINASTFEINEAETDFYVQQQKDQLEQTAAMYYGVDLETYLTQMLQTTMEQFEKDCAESALFTVKSMAVQKAIAEKENITVSEEEYTAGVENYMSYYGAADQAEFEKMMGKENITQALTFEKVQNFLMENAVSAEE